MVSWNNLAADRRVDAIAAAVQRVCLLVVIAVELLFFLPGEAADGLVYLFLEWKLVDISILFLAASFCRKYLRQSKWFFLLGLVIVVWFYVLRGVHLRLEGVNQDPGAFVCAYLLCLTSGVYVVKLAVNSLCTVSHFTAVEHYSTVEVGISNLVKLIVQLVEFELNSVAVNFVLICTVSCLGSEFLHSLKNGVRFLSCALEGLDHVDAVLRVADSLVQALDLASHLLGNCETCCVIACAIDSVARRKLFRRLLHACYVCVQLVVRVDRVHVVLYYHSRGFYPR